MKLIIDYHELEFDETDSLRISRGEIAKTNSTHAALKGYGKLRYYREYETAESVLQQQELWEVYPFYGKNGAKEAVSAFKWVNVPVFINV